MYAGWGAWAASYLLIGFWQYKEVRGDRGEEGVRRQPRRRHGLCHRADDHLHQHRLRVSDVLAASSTAAESTLTALGLSAAAGGVREVRAGPRCSRGSATPWRPDAGVGAHPTPRRWSPQASTSSSGRPGPTTPDGPDRRRHRRRRDAAVRRDHRLREDDIKKALAASTMSQIGYMVLAAGLGPAGCVFAIAHLLAHGFFKGGPVPRIRFSHAQ